MSAIRTGIIGYGLSGRIFHSPFVAANPAFSLDVISTANGARAQQAREQHPSATVVATPHELLDSELDLVVLASPAQAHVEQALEAIEAGIAVVIDKPFATSAAEATVIIQAAERSGVSLTVYQNRRWDGDFRTVRTLVESGALGRVHRFESTFERWSPALRDRWQDTTPTSEGAGISYDLGSHLVDQALQLFGPATLESAELSVLREGGVSDDEAFLALLHDSGVRSHLTMSRFAAQNAPRFRVLGSTSGYTVDGLDGQEPALMAGAGPADPDFGVVPEERWGRLGITGSAENPPVPHPTERGDYAAFYAAVAESLREGSPMPVDPRDALAALALIDEAHRITGI